MHYEVKEYNRRTVEIINSNNDGTVSGLTLEYIMRCGPVGDKYDTLTPVEIVAIIIPGDKKTSEQQALIKTALDAKCQELYPDTV